MSDELLKIFLGEAEEQLETMSKMLLALEEDHDDRESLDEIFRAAHSLKGASATLGYNNIAMLTHDMETLMDTFRKKEREVNKESVDVILKCFDCVTSMIEMVEDGKDDDVDIAQHRENIAALLRTDAAQGIEDSSEDGDEGITSGRNKWFLTEYDRLVVEEALSEHLNVFDIEVGINDDEGMKDIRCMIIANQLKEVGELVSTLPNLDDEVSTQKAKVFHYLLVTEEDKLSIFDTVGKIDINHIEINQVDADFLAAKSSGMQVLEDKDYEGTENAKIAETNTTLKKSLEKEKDSKQQTASTRAISSIRVDTDRLDSIMNLVGELVINRTMFVQLRSSLAGMEKELDDLGVNVKNFKTLKALQADFDSIHQRMGRISTELQERVMQIRLLPISIVFTRFTRLVRDLASSMGKDVNIIISGENTEIDKTVIEVIGDPLIHIVRNAVSHGIELPEDRLAAGKETRGTVWLDARHEGNHVVVEVSDDGKGLDREKILKKAIAKNSISPESAAHLSDREVYDFIFEPDFSTADVVNDISGRGVGLDVVAKNIEKLSGSIEIKTKLGEGTKFTLRFPLTLAIIQALLARVAGETFCIPLGSILETVRITPADIKTIEGREVMMLRGNVISLLKMNEVLELGEAQYEKHMFVVVVGVGEKRVGLIVDKLVGRQEIVIKIIDDEFITSPEIAGATVLGNGTISLIFDINSLVEMGMTHMNNKLDKRQK